MLDKENKSAANVDPLFRCVNYWRPGVAACSALLPSACSLLLAWTLWRPWQLAGAKHPWPVGRMFSSH